MSEHILQLVITVVAVALFLCYQSVTCNGPEGYVYYKKHSFTQPRIGPKPEVTESQYQDGLKICHSKADNTQADEKCKNLSNRYKGICEETLIQFPNKFETTYFTLTAVCLDHQDDRDYVVGCLSKKTDNPNDNELLYWNARPFLKKGIEVFHKEIRPPSTWNWRDNGESVRVQTKPQYGIQCETDRYLGLAICKSAEDEGAAADLACKNLSNNQYKGKCEQLPMKFSNNAHLYSYELRWTAICYTPADETVGCLSRKTNNNQNDELLYWDITPITIIDPETRGEWNDYVCEINRYV